MRTLHINGMTPPALAIVIALKEKGLEFRIVDVDWHETPAAFSRLAETREIAATLEGEFPILVDADIALSDSYFVLEYLDDAYAVPPLRPREAYDQWQLQALARFFGERALPAVSTLGVAERFAADDGELRAIFAEADVLTRERRDAWLSAGQSAAGGAIEESQRKLVLLFERLEGLLAKGRPWLLGQDYTISDIAAFALVHPFLDGPLERGDAPVGEALRLWHGRMLERPAVKAALKLRPMMFLPGPEHARWG